MISSSLVQRAEARVIDRAIDQVLVSWPATGSAEGHSSIDDDVVHFLGRHEGLRDKAADRRLVACWVPAMDRLRRSI
jgi:hypothetical protein